MGKPLLLLLQVGSWHSTASYRSDNRFLLVLPCPRRCCATVRDCWSMILLLVMLGDVEQNPGPKTTELLELIIENQATSDCKLGAINEEIAKLHTKTDKLTDYVEVIKDLNRRIDSLENLVRQQAEKLIEFETRSRRHNLLVFGLLEENGESESTLKAAVVDTLFRETLGVQVQTVERIHRLGKKKPGSPRPVILGFYDSREKEQVLRNCRKLKGSQIRISNDYPKEIVEVRKKLWASASVDRNNGKRVTLVHDKLKVNDQFYVWDHGQNERCLCHEYRQNDASGGTRSSPALDSRLGSQGTPTGA
ncbi:uncharacterized protein ISCGN_015927 [Ixodes scapularis]